MKILSGPMVAAVLILVTGCAQLDKSDSPQVEEMGALSEQGQIRVSVCEITVREVVTQPSITPVFIALGEQEHRTLTRHLPNFLLRSTSKAEFVGGRGYRDKDSGMFGLLVSLSEGEISDSNATIRAGYSFGSPVGVNGRFEFNLVRDDGWRVTHTNHTRIIR